MVYGNTVDMLPRQRAHNSAVLASYLTVDIACQLQRPTGHAVHPVPLTEAERVPSGAENLEVQLIGHEIEREVRRSGDVYDWSRAERLGAAVAAYAQEFRDRALGLLVDDGVAVNDPGAVLMALRALGMARLEQRVDLRPPREVAELVPWKARHVDAVRTGLDGELPDLRGVRLVLAVLDVHDVVRDALVAALPRAGGEVVLLPSDSTPAGVVQVALQEDAGVIVLGTYNGAALSLGRELAVAITATGFDGIVIIGGKLNEDTGGEVPVDVVDELRALGLHPAATLSEASRVLTDYVRRARPS